ncbi:MAG: beta-L-arabinofuranosidase domain-containing protein [Thermoguttaceae bacterium]
MTPRRCVGSFALLILLQGMTVSAEPIVRLADKVPAVVSDRQDIQVPDRVHLSGMLGQRIQRSDVDRLLNVVDCSELLAGFRHRPGSQDWIGEHYGKWLDAATLAWACTGDARLRAKMDATVAGLLKCQFPDGYLGTYVAKNRWTSWDVWVHKYNLIGLITYVQYTGDTTPLPACRKMADLLCKEFGDKPGQRDIVNGEHAGMAPGSVLEPMVRLYRLTGEPRYGDFCRYILRAYEHANGPKIVSRLLDKKGVDRVGDAKAYEMLSCLVGIAEWYRTTGDRKYLDALLNAWNDIVAKRLYITGGSSWNEHFLGDYDLPNQGNLCETCVTVTWIELNSQLLRLTGEARFAEQLERVVYNQLLGAQHPNGKAWDYYVQMEGKKPYDDSLHVNCCASSGPRGISYIPTFAVTTDADGVVVNFYDAGDADLRLRDGREVKLHIDSAYPADGNIAITVNPAVEGEFTLKFRQPEGCGGFYLHSNFTPIDVDPTGKGYLSIKRTWKPSDKLELALNVEPRIIIGDHKNAGKVAVMAGPLVLAADDELLNGTGLDVEKLVIEAADPTAASFERQPAPPKFRLWPKTCVYVFKPSPATAAYAKGSASPIALPLVPFADAGMTGAAYKVWLPLKK